MVVGVVNGGLGNLDGRTIGEYVYLTLQITNLGTKPTTYPSWARPDIRVTLRDQNGHSFERIHRGHKMGYESTQVARSPTRWFSSRPRRSSQWT